MNDASSARPKSGFDIVDLAITAGIIALIYGMVAVAREWTGHLEPTPEIHLEARYLPLYALFSLTRGMIAYGVSFIFTIVYGYAAARIRGADRFLLPVLDILQSIPVLGFLPGLVLGLVHLFPTRNLGLEMASVLMIFTGQVWNMTFAFHASLKSIPEELTAVARLAKLAWWERILRLDLSYSATALVWNSMVSMAGGWFFLTVSEAFVLGDRDFRLPGLGSYMSIAIEAGNTKAEILGVISMFLLIVILDQLLWKPLVVWSQKFNAEDSEPRVAVQSWFWERIRRSRIWGGILKTGKLWRRNKRSRPLPPSQPASLPIASITPLARSIKWTITALLAAAIAFAVFDYLAMLRDLRLADWRHIGISAAASFGRVIAAVAIASLWTIPIGVLIGRNPRWTRIWQPIIQIVASFPAPMIYPVALGMVLAAGGGLGLGSILLMLLGTQWYLLFNLIAGTSAIPRELWEVARLSHFSWRLRWQKLILPAIFPSLLTGWITATGGAWNATVVAEYMKYKHQTVTTVGLGALISQATDHAQFHLLAAAVGVMSLLVVVFNRLVWRPLGQQALTRFTLNS